MINVKYLVFLGFFIHLLGRVAERERQMFLYLLAITKDVNELLIGISLINQAQKRQKIQLLIYFNSNYPRILLLKLLLITANSRLDGEISIFQT